MRDLPPELLRGPFTPARARALGISDDVLGGRRLRRLRTGVYVAADEPDSFLLACRAALLVLPRGAVFSHDTAARLAGLPVPYGTDGGTLHVTVPAGSNRVRAAGIVCHRSTLAAGDVTVAHGLRVTVASRTWCDVAALGWSRDDLVVFADAVLRRTGERGLRVLERRVATWGSRRGAQALRIAFALVALRVDSPPETLLRLAVHDAGLPEPEVNLPVYDVWGEVVHTPDLRWLKYRYALDYDGSHHFEDDREEEVRARRKVNWRRRHDIHRQEGMRGEGWLLTVATAYDLFRARAALLDRVRRGLRERGADC